MCDIRCDWKGTCGKLPYAEVYILDGDNHYWSFLCRWHYILDRIRHGHKHGYCILNKESVKNAIKGKDIELLN